MDSAMDLVASMVPRMLFTYSEDDDLFVGSPFQLATLLFVILVIFIILAVLFVLVKDYVLESSSKYVRPIIICIFGEMTVLGFLSVLTFVVGYGGTLDALSIILFGDAGSDFIDSTLEEIHYMLFLIMVLAIAEVFMLIGIGNVCMSNFDEMDLISQDKVSVEALVEKADKLRHVTYSSWVYGYLTNLDPRVEWTKNEDMIRTTETLVFYSLRREFIECRNPLPPYELAPKSKRLPRDFDYAKYQTIFLIMFALDGWYFFLCQFWLVLGWVDTLQILLLLNKCVDISEYLVNPAHFRPSNKKLDDDDEESSQASGGRGGGKEGHKEGKKSDKGDKKEPDETTGLLGAKQAEELAAQSMAMANAFNPFPTDEPRPGERHSNVVRRALAQKDANGKPINKPVWCTVEDYPQSTISWLALGEAVPNKQEQLFWGDKLGRDINIYILRVHLITQSIYISVGLCIWVPYMFKMTEWYWATIYLFFLLLPVPVQFLGFYPALVPVMSHIACTGLFKDQKTVVDVLAQQKMTKFIRLMTTLTKLKAKNASEARKTGPGPDRSDPHTRVEIAEISKIFDLFDEKKTGEIDTKQLAKLFKAMGLSLSEQELREVMIHVDTDGSGTVSKEEFIAWKLEHRNEDREESLKQMADDVWKVFAPDEKTKSVTAEHFMECIGKLDPTMDKRDLAQIAADLDEEGAGSITKESFERTVKEALKG